MRILLTLIIFVATAMFIGYDAAGETNVTPEQMVAERALQRWTALIGQNFNRAYEFETPGFRQTTPIGGYRNFYGNAVKWENAQVTKVELSSDQQRAKIIVTIDYKGPNAGGEGVYQGQGSVTENWLLTNGNWWYVRSTKGLK